MENSPNRFADPGLSLGEIATHFVVHCPKCTGKALIASVNQHHRLTCIQCFHVELPGHWYGAATAYVSVKCRECRAPIQHSAPWNGQWKKLGTRCDQCGDTCEYEASISKYHFSEGCMTDPVFGLLLWLQKEFRQDLFWAYNYEHLDLLRSYISAKLRERGIGPLNAHSKNRGMVGRLPDFMKKAGNRAELLKCIEILGLKSNR